jgi:hypothetical protein
MRPRFELLHMRPENAFSGRLGALELYIDCSDHSPPSTHSPSLKLLASSAHAIIETLGHYLIGV